MSWQEFTCDVDLSEYRAWPSIYDPYVFDDGGSRYSILAPVSAVPDWAAIDVPLRTCADGNTYALLRSNYPVEVVHPCMSTAIYELKCLEAKNLPRDRIFDSKKLRLYGAKWEMDDERVEMVRRAGYNPSTRHILILIKVEILA